MRVMGLDSAMRNSGYVVLDFDPAEILTLKSPNPTHALMKRVADGTVSYSDTDETRLSRLVSNARDVQDLVSKYTPDIVTIEGALDKGPQRSSTGTALYTLLAGPWFLGKALMQSEEKQAFVPPVVVTLSPERHMAAAHEKRSLTGTEVVKKYRDLVFDKPKGRVSEHQADAYFLAYLGSRFWMTKKGIWPRSILTPKEDAIFFDFNLRDSKNQRRLASKSMINEEGSSWWDISDNKSLQATTDKPEDLPSSEVIPVPANPVDV
jgi:hypothetical protein